MTSSPCVRRFYLNARIRRIYCLSMDKISEFELHVRSCLQMFYTDLDFINEIKFYILQNKVHIC